MIVIIWIMIYGYIKPYKDKKVNYLELTVLTILFAVLVLHTNPSLQDNLAIFPENNTSTTYNTLDCGKEVVHFITPLAKLLLVGYYTPLVLMVFVFIVVFLVIIRNWYRQFRFNRLTSFEEIEVEIPMKCNDHVISYYLAFDDHEALLTPINQ